MYKLVPELGVKNLIEFITSDIRNRGKFNFEFGNVQLRDLICFAEETDVFGLNFQVAFRKFTFSEEPSIDSPRQRYFAGIYLKDGVIALNTQLSFRDRCFTLAHELGHIMLGHIPVIDSTVWQKMELLANYFAYSLLMPEERFIQVAYNYDFHLSSLSKHYCCPIERIMKRLVIVFDETQYISLRNGGAKFLISKYCKNPSDSKSLEMNGIEINNDNINQFLDKYEIPRKPRSYFRCEIPIADTNYMFKFQTRYDIFHNIEILGFGYNMEKKYEVVPHDPNG